MTAPEPNSRHFNSCPYCGEDLLHFEEVPEEDYPYEEECWHCEKPITVRVSYSVDYWISPRTETP